MYAMAICCKKTDYGIATAAATVAATKITTTTAAAITQTFFKLDQFTESN